MGIFSYFQSKNGNTQVEQRLHSPLALDPVLKEPLVADVSHTIEQLSGDGNTPVSLVAPKSFVPVAEAVAGFVDSHPQNMFVIDGARDVQQSIICTQDGPSKTCLKLGANLVELFRTMQKLEYFCSLPDDINATYFECRKIR